MTVNIDTSPILIRSHGLPVDHVALAVSNTIEGAAYVKECTGVAPILHDTEPGQWYRSASLAIGSDSNLEIIGPNPEHRGPHPRKLMLRGLKAPALLFWYMATSDWPNMAKAVEASGHTIKHDERMGVPGRDARAYRRAMIGPGFVSQRPSVIEWYDRPANASPACELVDFELSLPDPTGLQRLFDVLGLSLSIAKGADRFSITLTTPNGLVTFANPGFRLSPSVLFNGLWRSIARP